MSLWVFFPYDLDPKFPDRIQSGIHRVGYQNPEHFVWLVVSEFRKQSRYAELGQSKQVKQKIPDFGILPDRFPELGQSKQAKQKVPDFCVPPMYITYFILTTFGRV